ncbi:acyl-CoA N-acyltransferase [Lentinula raphanica]|nr:acyl-CoA N-acyltransferase [Lentinula raphanica]KAJ3772950.1 acyl-CoA N-acyltransferase [Lentinula raphanica]KAJ3975404.1 acyl-CoA N-acyltransferase [Lentinula raphanica]
MSDFIIRPLVASDVEKVKKLHATLVPVSYPPSFFLHLLIQNSHSCLIALEPSTDEPVAWVSASLQKSNSSLIRSPEPHIQILTLGVLPEYQHRGLAKRLVWEVIASLHKDPSVPVPPVYTHVCTTNTPAQAFYEHIGMRLLPGSNPSGAPYVAKNLYNYPPAWTDHVTVPASRLFESRDAYVLVGKVTG